MNKKVIYGISPQAVQHLIEDFQKAIEKEMAYPFDAVIASHFMGQIAANLRYLYITSNSNRISHPGIEKTLIHNARQEMKAEQLKENGK